jgi:transposase InsO family protein
VVQWRLEHAGGYHLCRASLQRAGLQPPAAATIRKLWLRAGLLVVAGPRIRPVTRWVPPRPQAAGHVQVDVKYLPGRRYEFTALDVYSRFAAARVTESLDAATARSFLLELLEQLPFTLHTVQVDGGSEFRAEFAAELERRGLGLRRNSPHSPWQNGVVERFHRTVASECYALLDCDPQAMSTAALERELQTYLQHYNYQRLHSSLGYRPPAELLGTCGEPVYPQIPKRCPTIP